MCSLIEQNLKQPAAIKKFGFSNRYALAKAMYYDKENDSLWRSLKNLNNLRNDLSHNLEASQLESKAKEFIDSVQGLELLTVLTHGKLTMNTTEERTRSSLIFMCGRLDGLRRNAGK